MNSEFLNINLLVGFIFIVVLVFIGIKYRGKKTDDEYLVAGRSVGPYILAGTLAAGVVGGGIILTFSEYAYQYGMGALSIFGGIAIGLLALVFIANKYKPEIDKQYLYSFSDFFNYKWGKLAGLLATIVIAAWAFGFIIMQFIAAGVLLSNMLPIHYEYGIILSAVIILIYLMVGGFRAVVITDIFQFGGLFVFLIIIIGFALPHVDYSNTLNLFTQMKIEEIIGFFILGFLNVIVSADLWQRIYSAKSLSDAKKGLWLSSFLVILLGVLLGVIILYVKGQDLGLSSNTALVSGLGYLLPKGILGLAFTAILFAILSTLDTMVFIFGLSFANDIEINVFNRPITNRITSIKIWMFLITILGVILAIVYPKLLQVGLALSSLGLILVPTIVMYLKWNIKKYSVIGSIIAGLITFIVLFISGQFTPINAVITLPAAIVGFIAGSIVGRLKEN